MPETSEFYKTEPLPETPEAVTYEAEERQIEQPTQTVAGQLGGLLEAESPYLTAARTRGEQEAAKRGLLSTSMAAGATEKAAIEAALPIAQQDAETYFRQSLTAQEAINRARAQGAELGTQAEMAAGEFEQQRYFREQDVLNRMRLEEAQFGQKQELSAQEYQQTLERQRLQSAVELEKQQIGEAATSMRQQFEISSREFTTMVNRDMQLRIQALNVSQADRTSFTEYIKDTGQQHSVQMTNIAMDPQLTADEKNRALLNLQNSYRGNMEVMTDLYAIDISWTGGTPTAGTELGGVLEPAEWQPEPVPELAPEPEPTVAQSWIERAKGYSAI